MLKCQKFSDSPSKIKAHNLLKQLSFLFRMKHPSKVVATLVVFFFLSQFVGLLIINQYIDHQKTAETKEVVIKELPYGIEAPEVENQSLSFVYIMVQILIGTILLLLIIKFNKPVIWKFMFFIAIWFTLLVSFGAFINEFAASIIAFVIAIWRLYKPNAIIQNLSEIFIL